MYFLIPPAGNVFLVSYEPVDITGERCRADVSQLEMPRRFLATGFESFYTIRLGVDVP